MSTSFAKYSDVLLDAFQNNIRCTEIVDKKKEILDDIIDQANHAGQSILFVGFCPAILGVKKHNIFVTEVSEAVKQFLTQNQVSWSPANLGVGNKYDIIVALDEYFTFADNDQHQKDLVDSLCNLCNRTIITSLRDYKNQDFRDREFSQPILIKSTDSKRIYFEHYEYHAHDRNSSFGTNYIINDDGVMVVGPFVRRHMFFKQLAKFSLDCGARNFLVHKNLMHKSVIKKNYEHIITINF